MDNVGPFLPQQMYKPHTTSDRKRYVEEVSLEAPLYFVSERSQQYGIRLEDALHLRTRKLRDRDQVVFEGRGPSVSIRLEVRFLFTADSDTTNVASPISGPDTGSGLARSLPRTSEARLSRSLLLSLPKMWPSAYSVS